MKQNKCSNILSVIYILLCIAIAMIDFYTSGVNSCIGYLKIVMVVIAVIILLKSLIEIFILGRWPIIKWLKNCIPIIIVICITIAIPVFGHFVFYRTDSKLNESDLLMAYATYLTFLGALCLGYFLYKRDEKRRCEELRKKARLLYEIMQNIYINFRNIDGCIEREECFSLHPSWRSDYLDIQHLVKYNETSLHSELEFFFNSVEAINKAILSGNKKRAKVIYTNFEKKEKYSSSDYNYMDASEVLLYISLEIPQNKPWTMLEKKQIDLFAEQFFDVVSIWVYNYLLQQHVSSRDAYDVNYKLVDWLLTNPELRAWVKHPYENRKISAVIHKIAMEMPEKSDRIDYCWGEYSLKRADMIL